MASFPLFVRAIVTGKYQWIGKKGLCSVADPAEIHRMPRKSKTSKSWWCASPKREAVSNEAR